MKAFAAPALFALCLSTVSAQASTEIFPNYLIPISEAAPGVPLGTQYIAQINYTSPQEGNEIRMLVGFDVPPNLGTRCAIKFALGPKPPGAYQWTVIGSGKLSVWSLKTIINLGTSWANKPERTTVNPVFKLVQPLAGGAAVVTGSTIPIRGPRMDFEVTATRPSPTFFDWFELDSPKTGITLGIYP